MQDAGTGQSASDHDGRSEWRHGQHTKNNVLFIFERSNEEHVTAGIHVNRDKKSLIGKQAGGYVGE